MVKTYGTSFMAVVYGIYLGQIFKTFLQHGNNNAMKIILELPNTAHRRFLDQLSGLNHIHHILKCHFIKFMQSLLNNNNNKIVHL